MNNEERTYPLDDELEELNPDLTLKEALEERRRRHPQNEGIIELSFFNLFWIFVIASFFGLIIETVVSYPIDGVWKDRAGFVWGPLSPIYGVGGVLMTVGLNNMRGQTALHTFAFAAFLGGMFEFCVGWILEEAFGIVAWSYIDQPFNLMGHTCLGIALVWGVLGLMWVRMILPLVMDLISLIPQRIAHGLTTACALFIAVDIVLTLGAFNCWFERSAGEPISNPVQEFFATNFGDEFMEQRFQTMSIYPEVADRGMLDGNTTAETDAEEGLSATNTTNGASSEEDTSSMTSSSSASDSSSEGKSSASASSATASNQATSTTEASK